MLSPRRKTRKNKNAPCPCGSGRKLKSCCQQQAEQHEPQRRTHAQLDQLLAARINAWAEAHECIDRDPPVEDAARTDEILAQWHAYDSHPGGKGEILLQRFLEAPPAPALTPAEQRWCELQQQAWVGLWIVTAITPGLSATLTDALSGHVRKVIDRPTTRRAATGDLIIARVIPLEQSMLYMFSGVYPQIIPADYTSGVIADVRGFLQKICALPERGVLTPEQLCRPDVKHSTLLVIDESSEDVQDLLRLTLQPH